MRTSPLVGKKVWFGPRRFGWGWSPVSSEGWIVTALSLGAILGGTVLKEEHPVAHLVGSIAIVVLLLCICVAKGTPPGGPAAHSEFSKARVRGASS